MALDKHNPNKPINPLDLLNNYDKPGNIVPPYPSNPPVISSYQIPVL
jgi:hypothetical protein